jgi:hypothetical protein
VTFGDPPGLEIADVRLELFAPAVFVLLVWFLQNG